MAKKILVKGVNWVGDTILSLPALKLIKEKLYPDSQVSILVKQSLSSLFQNSSYVDEVIPYALRKNFFLKILDRLKIIRILRKKSFNTTLILPNSFDSACLIFLAKIPQRIGYAGNLRSLLLTRKIPKTKEILEKHQVEYYVNLLKNLDSAISSYAPPQLSISQDMESQVQEKFLKENSKSLVGINPGAVYGPAKRWPKDKYITLCQKLIENFDYQIILFGSKEEQKLNNEIEKSLRQNIINTTGQTSLIEAAAIIKQCKVFVTNDSGLMHVAAAVGTPIAAIFGPTKENNTSPTNTHLIIRCKEILPCVPCLKRKCPLKHHKCMELIDEQIVLAGIKKLISP